MSDQLSIPSRRELPLWRFVCPGKPADDELKFRQHYLDSDTKQVRAILLISIALMVVTSIADIPRMAEVDGLSFGVVLRTIMAFTATIFFWALNYWRIPRTLDIGVALFTLLTAASIAYFHLTTDVSAARIAAIGTLFIFVANITFPIYGVFLLPAVMVFLGIESMVIFDAAREPITQQRSIIIIVFVFSELMSILASAYSQRTRYMAYRALAEVKTLSGMIPICSNCKKIRDDSGYYQQLEQYISSHSGAQFSHGVCPDCVAVLYPGFNSNDISPG